MKSDEVHDNHVNVDVSYSDVFFFFSCRAGTKTVHVEMMKHQRSKTPVTLYVQLLSNLSLDVFGGLKNFLKCSSE